MILLVVCYDDIIAVKCGTTSSPQRFQFVRPLVHTNLAWSPEIQTRQIKVINSNSGGGSRCLRVKPTFWICFVSFILALWWIKMLIDSVWRHIQLLSIVMFVTAASVFYQIHSQNDLDYFLWLIVVSSILQTTYIHIRGAFWGTELTRYQEPQTTEPKPTKCFRFQKSIPFFQVEKFDKCKDMTMSERFMSLSEPNFTAYDDRLCKTELCIVQM